MKTPVTALFYPACLLKELGDITQKLKYPMCQMELVVTIDYH